MNKCIRLFWILYIKSSAVRMPPGFTGESSSEAASICCASHSSPTHHTNHHWMVSLLLEGVLVTQTDAALLPSASCRVTGLSLGKEKRKGRTHVDGRSFQKCWVILRRNPGDSEPRETTCWAVKCLGTGDSHPSHARLSLAGLQAFVGRRSVHERAAPLLPETLLDEVSSWSCCGTARIGEIGKYWTQILVSLLPQIYLKCPWGTEQQKQMRCGVVFVPVTGVLFLPFSFFCSSSCPFIRCYTFNESHMTECITYSIYSIKPSAEQISWLFKCFADLFCVKTEITWRFLFSLCLLNLILKQIPAILVMFC